VDKPKKRLKHIAAVVVLVVLWGVLLVMAYKVFTMEREYTEYDPYSILELDTVCLWMDRQANGCFTWTFLA